MRIFKTRWFERFARKEEIGDSALRKAINEANKGIIDAELGSGVIKLRIARPGRGKSKGYRALVVFRRHDRAFFIYGFAKSDRANISEDELRQFRKAAGHVLAVAETQLAELVKRGDFIELREGQDEE